MENKSNDFNISFFKPTTKLAKINRNLSFKLLTIWALAIFGFHFFMRVIEKPTPEPAYISYQNVWENIKNGDATTPQKQEYIKSTLMVLGKLIIKAEDKAILDKSLGSVFTSLLANEKKEGFTKKIAEFNSLKGKIKTLADKKYVALRDEITKECATTLGVKTFSLEAKIIPFELTSENLTITKDVHNENVEAVMAKYLIHNQSFLTDMQFLGYPFHYFYTSVFLLVLFIGLCWIYCYRIDKIYHKLGLEN